MPDPQYRRLLQELTDLLLVALPERWGEATLSATFPSRIRTRLEVSCLQEDSSGSTPVELPAALAHDLVGAVRAVRTELVVAGNPECRRFVFWLSRAGKSSMDVEY
jgi:hypothetical protein